MSGCCQRFIEVCTLPCQLRDCCLDRLYEVFERCWRAGNGCVERPCSGFAIMSLVLAGSACVCAVTDILQGGEQLDAGILAGFSAVHVVFALYLQRRLIFGLREAAQKRAQLSGSALSEEQEWQNESAQDELRQMWQIVIFDLGFTAFAASFIATIFIIPRLEGLNRFGETGRLLLYFQLILAIMWGILWGLVTSCAACCECLNRFFLPACPLQPEVVQQPHGSAVTLRTLRHGSAATLTSQMVVQPMQVMLHRPAAPQLQAVQPGHPQQEASVCGQCGRPVQSVARFCSACGTPIPEVRPPTQQYIASTGSPPPPGADAGELTFAEKWL